MKKKLTTLIISIICLSLLSGCCISHKWQDATCAAPKTCTECGKTKGEPLAHTWQEATTDAPKTCTICGATEGKRILTDPRFTTAATKQLHGNWVGHISVDGALFGFDDFEERLYIEFLLQFQTDGSIGMEFTVTNSKQFTSALSEYLYASLYKEFSGEGMDKEAVEAAILDTYGMSAEQYVATITKGLDFVSIISMLNNVTGVYYIDGGLLYTGISWDSYLEPMNFTLNENTLVLEKDFTGLTNEALAFQRADN